MALKAVNGACRPAVSSGINRNHRCPISDDQNNVCARSRINVILHVQAPCASST